MSDGRQIGITLPVVLAIVVHGALGGGVEGAKRLGWFATKARPQVVEFVVQPPKPKEVEPPPPPPPRIEPEKLPEPPKEVEPPKQKLVKKVDPKAPPPETETPPEEVPAAGPPGDAPPSEYTYKMPAGTGNGSMGVTAGAKPTGSARGVKGGKGDGTGGGGPPDSQGTGGEPKVASVAAIKTQPQVIGDYDRLDAKEYPPEAKRAGIEGQVQVRILVDADGKPARVKLLKGLGHGLDEKALELAKRIKFKPARDTNDQAVAFWITWTFNFVLPD